MSGAAPSHTLNKYTFLLQSPKLENLRNRSNRSGTLSPHLEEQNEDFGLIRGGNERKSERQSLPKISMDNQSGA
jgi:hypothetical protein